MSSIVISGDTSGSVTLQAPAIAGSTVVTLPTTSMNMGTGGGSIATNTAFGASALAANTSGATNTAIGASALAANTTASTNTAVGYQAGNSNTTGTANNFIGKGAGFSNTTAGDLTYIGLETGYYATGQRNTFVGGQSAVGVSGSSVGTNNTAIGYRSFESFTSASNNVAVGELALKVTSSGAYNIAVGNQALYSNTTASNNTAVGYQAGYSNIVSQYNTFVGAKAGYSTTGASNAFFGDESGYSATTGVQNTFIGQAAGYSITTGSKNTILGQYSGNQGGLDIRTSSNRIVLSDGDGNPRLIGDNAGAFFINRTSTYSYANGALCVEGTGGNPCIVAGTAGTTSYNNMVFGNGNGGVGSISTNGSATAFNTSSDYRLKEAIAPMTGALAKVAALKPCTYKWKVDGSDGQGFIAHELAEVEAGCVTGEKDAVDADGNPQYQGIDTSFLVATLTAAIQEQQALITTLTTRITALEAKVGA